MIKAVLKIKTRKFAVDYWRLRSRFSVSKEFNAHCNQSIRCLGSIDVNYRVKSNADFIKKSSAVEEGADESMDFLELFSTVSYSEQNKIDRILNETNEFSRIIVAPSKIMGNRKS